MKNQFQRVLSVCLAVVVFFATTSFTVDMHFCGNTLVDFSIFHNVKSCGMEKPQLQKSCEKEFSKKSCCSDQQLCMGGVDQLKLNSTTISFGQQLFVAAFFYTYRNLFEGLDQNIIPFKGYMPPKLTRDVQKLHETYLI